MPKIERNITSDSIHHIYNRSVDKRTIFYTDDDYCWLIDKMLYYKIKYKIKILAFALLPTHFHLLLQESDSGSGIVKFISCLCNSYSRHFNIMHERSGPLFEGRFKSKLVEDDDYLQKLINYINLNPLKHKIVKNIKNWDYISHWDYIEKSKFNLLDNSELIDFDVYQNGIEHYIEKLNNMEVEF